MNFELNPNRGVKPGPHIGRTQHVCVCAATKTASPLTCVLQLPCTLTGCDTAGAGQHRLIRSAPSDQISTIEACGRRSRTE